MDRYDQAILDILATDGRISVAELARRIGLSKTPTLSRMRRLEAEGLIRGYRADLDLARLGAPHIAFVEMRLSDTREPALRAFDAAVRRLPEVEACHMIAGAFDYLLKVRTSDIAAYRRVLGESLSRLPHVASTSTHVVMDTVIDYAPPGPPTGE